MKEKINLFMKKLKEMPDFNKVEFVFLFGSVAEKKDNKLSDIDFAVFHSGDSKERFRFRIKLLTKLPEKYDVQIFQDLPLYVRINVLKGKIIYAKNESFVYEKAYDTIKKFDDYKKYYYDYINTRKIRI
jgi:predicted nucleotidyltransferase